MAREGMLIQIDGSHHRWLGEDGPQFTLLLAVDAATGCVVNALFCLEETTRDYFHMLEGLIRRWGVPLALYADRHTTFKATPGTGQKVRAAPQFARAMDELGIRMIFARSPQGKGRVGRMAGTFQDRLVRELRRSVHYPGGQARACGLPAPASTSGSGYRRSRRMRHTVPLIPMSVLTASSV